mmetsp:Transcript_7966/g.17970  ORF Transcript_7966/g.17970 Transcript_7966/m.17970 type:complete len:430 (-) Transcript_7966:35-1324(-)
MANARLSGAVPASSSSSYHPNGGNASEGKMPRSNMKRFLSLFGIISILHVCLTFIGSLALDKDNNDNLDAIMLLPQNFSEPILYDPLEPLDTTATNMAEVIQPIETVLIIATAPYSADHVMALWTHLECVTEGIDKVLISAPDTPWSREIIATIVKKFKQHLRDTNSTVINLDAAFYTNNRYDVGLWCDGLSLNLGFDGNDFADNATAAPRAIFLINDSSVSLRRYKSLTDRIVKSAQIEQTNQNNGNGNVKLVSLNGDLVQPGITKHYWVESVYRGLTPNGVSTFYQHSCTAEAGRACARKTGNAKKQCIVNRYEMSLSDSFPPSAVDAMYPTYLPKEWDASSWEETGGGIGPTDQWIRGRRYFRYLHEVHSFPLRKIKWPARGQPPPPKSQCLKLINDNPQFDKLPFPSTEAFEAFQEEMFKSESSL